jgi:hypothetical protein
MTAITFRVAERDGQWYVLWGEHELGPGFPSMCDAAAALAVSHEAWLLGWDAANEANERAINLSARRN